MSEKLNAATRAVVEEFDVEGEVPQTASEIEDGVQMGLYDDAIYVDEAVCFPCTVFAKWLASIDYEAAARELQSRARTRGEA